MVSFLVGKVSRLYSPTLIAGKFENLFRRDHCFQLSCFRGRDVLFVLGVFDRSPSTACSTPEPRRSPQRRSYAFSACRSGLMNRTPNISALRCLQNPSRLPRSVCSSHQPNGQKTHCNSTVRQSYRSDDLVEKSLTKTKVGHGKERAKGILKLPTPDVFPSGVGDKSRQEVPTRLTGSFELERCRANRLFSFSTSVNR